MTADQSNRAEGYNTVTTEASEWVNQRLAEFAEEPGHNLTGEERERRVAQDRLVLDPFLHDLRTLVAKHPGIKWYIDPGDVTDPGKVAAVGLMGAGSDGIEFCYGLAVEWVYCEEYPVLQPLEANA